MTAPRDWRWHGAPDPVTGIAPLAPSPAAHDVLGLLAEADAFCAEWKRAALRVQIVPDLALNVRDLKNQRDALADLYAEALAERDDARRDRDRLARRIQAIVAVAEGARVVLPDDEAPDDGPCGWNSR